MEKSYPNNTCPKLKEHYEKELRNLHLKSLLNDSSRNSNLTMTFDDIFFDFAHEKVTSETVKLLKEMVEESKLPSMIEAMFNGEAINKTEKRSVLHVALRSKPDQKFVDDKAGELKGFTDKTLKNLVVIGIGGSYLGIEFVYEAIRCHKDCVEGRATEGLNAEETLILVNSKTFTTAETMLNARTIQKWLFDQILGFAEKRTAENEKKVSALHVCACSTNYEETRKFGIQDDSVFEFWNWVGGRFSVCSPIGVLPLSIHFGFDIMKQFLQGANSIDTHFLQEKDLTKNIPMMIGVLGFYHSMIQGYSSRALLPYCQSLCKFAPHIQQLDMESNGKRVTNDGEEITYETGVVNFGEPGTNGQHSFYQLLHQGRAIPCEFIGFIKSQVPIDNPKEPVSNHDELMSNFFSQPDALACGKDLEVVKKEEKDSSVWTSKIFPGDRPSFSLLINELNPKTCGQLLAIYEHRTAVEGFLFKINSFDQMGVQLGKQLATTVRNLLKANRKATEKPDFQNIVFNSSTKAQLERYLQSK